MGASAALISIGRFARLTGLTIKALRHYDELGLLKPAYVDPNTGYRFYALTQATLAEQISVLRSAEMPLEEINLLLQASEDAELVRVLQDHRDQLAERVKRFEAAQEALDRLIRTITGGSPYAILRRDVPAVDVMSMRERFSSDSEDVHAFIGRAFFEVYRAVFASGAVPAGPGMRLTHEEGDDEVVIEVAVPVPPETALSDATPTPVQRRTLAAQAVVATLHSGSYDGLPSAHRALAWWAEQEHHRLGSPTRELFLVGPAQAHDPADYRTEVQAPLVMRPG